MYVGLWSFDSYELFTYLQYKNLAVVNYVLSFARKVGFLTDNVLLIEKNRPEWQAGRYNLPGGKIEEGETPEAAAVRELEEEAGIKPCLPATMMGTIMGSWGTVFCIKVPIFDGTINQPDNESEKVFWTNWYSVQDSPLLLPNLRVVIPMLMANQSDWVIKDEGPDWDKPLHTIEIMLNTGGE